MSTAPVTTESMNELPITREASLSSFLPLAIAQRGAPPFDPKSLANALIKDITGKHSPRPVSASEPFAARWPIYILSTML